LHQKHKEGSVTEQPTTKSTELAYRASDGLDVRLVWFPSHDDDKAVVASSPMTALGSYPAPSDDAEFTQLLLWAAVIPYVIEADHADGADELDVRGVRLLVEQADSRHAAALLSDQPRTDRREQQP
jgi:hypothetical protein